jgi:hypothetical protein
MCTGYQDIQELMIYVAFLVPRAIQDLAQRGHITDIVDYFRHL